MWDSNPASSACGICGRGGERDRWIFGPPHSGKRARASAVKDAEAGAAARVARERSGRIWWRIAWRNLWRNRRRTILTAAALSFGFVSAVLMIALMDGMTEEMVSNGTRVVTGQVQIHSSDYRPERSIHDTMGGRAGIDVAGTVAAIQGVDGVGGVAPRVYGGGLVSSGNETAGAVLMGLDAVREEAVSRFGAAMAEGRLPSGRGEIAIGAAMAETIGAGLGDEVVLVAPAADGSTGNDLFAVTGIFRLGVGGYDDGYALLELATLQELMALDPGRIHEMAISVARIGEADAVAERVTGAVGGAGLVIEPWSVFLEQLYFMTSLMDAANGIVALMIFGMAIFGVANTMLLATFERRREFAVARALGTSGRAIVRIVVCEGLFLGVVALAAGAVVAIPVVVWFHEFPLDLSAFVGTYEMMGSAMRPYLTAEYSWDGPLISALALVGTGLASALYPAWRAVRIPPADALAGR